MKLSMVESAIGFYVIGYIGQMLPRRQPTMIPGSPLLRVLCLRPFSRQLELAATTIQALGLYILGIHGLLWVGVISAASTSRLDLAGFIMVVAVIIVDLVISERKRRK